jgi:hypothetical protein
LRLYIDTNDMDHDGWCHLIRHEGRLIDEVAAELGLVEGMAVILFNADPAEEFEYDGIVSHRTDRWLGRADLASYRLLRESPVDSASSLLGGQGSTR